MLDLKITGGVIFDGTGRDRFNADIGIRDGQIVEIDQVDTRAKREIHADGAMVTPGFVDMHTHYDAQVFWDNDLMASSRNGVTTAVMGNCGVGCAPLIPAIQDDVTSLFEGVEDIPRTSIESALDWEWDSFGSYLNRIGQRQYTIDLAVNATHAPIRMIAMGERAFDSSKATADDISKMTAMLTEALDAGAVAFSTDRIAMHQMGDGRNVPDYLADRNEMLALAKVVARYPGRPIQFASDYGMTGTEEDTLRELSLLQDVARLGVPVYTPLQQYPCEGGWRRLVRDISAMNDAGARISFEACPRAIGVLMSLEALIHPFTRHPSYMAIADLPLEERVKQMRDSSLRKRILSEKPTPGEDEIRMLRRLNQIYQNAGHIFIVHDKADYEPEPAQSIKSIAERENRTLEEVFYDALIARDGRQFLYMPIANFTDGSLDEQHAILSTPGTLISFGDAGAHVAQICDAAYTSFVLSHWGRDRKQGLSLERLVNQMTKVQADMFGFADRGHLAVGARADINVIDHEALALDPPVMLHDLPGGASRLMQTATGYLQTLVAGVSVVENDSLTGMRPGGVLRR